LPAKKKGPLANISVHIKISKVCGLYSPFIVKLQKRFTKSLEDLDGRACWTHKIIMNQPLSVVAAFIGILPCVVWSRLLHQERISTCAGNEQHLQFEKFDEVGAKSWGAVCNDGSIGGIFVKPGVVSDS
jgi:hypothetical protein